MCNFLTLSFCLICFTDRQLCNDRFSSSFVASPRAQGARARDPGSWVHVPAAQLYEIGHSNPYFSAVKYLHIRCCSIGTELNKASVLDEM